MNNIHVIQNNQKQIERLVAQRELYSTLLTNISRESLSHHRTLLRMKQYLSYTALRVLLSYSHAQ